MIILHFNTIYCYERHCNQQTHQHLTKEVHTQTKTHYYIIIKSGFSVRVKGWG